MHIPDGFIDIPTSLGAGALAAAGIGLALRRSEAVLAQRAVPLAGLLSAFVFAAQMLNVPVAVGTSVHLLGAGLAAALLGPWLASVSLGVVILVQALLFADGGVIALGLNLVNMALVAPWLAWAALRLARAALPRRPGSLTAAAFLGGAIGVLGAAVAFGVEYAVGGVGGAPPRLVAGAMIGTHLVLGLGEGVVTAAIVRTVLSLRPDLVAAARPSGGAGAAPLPARGGRPRGRPRGRLAGGLLVLAALALAAVAGPFASALPDGLERVALDLGFAAAQRGAVLPAAFAGYRLPGAASHAALGPIGLSITGIVGVLSVLAAVAGVRAVARSRAAAARGPR